MFDKNGVKIINKMKLQSALFGDEGAEMRCFGYREYDGNIILGQDRPQEVYTHLTQEELLASKWVAVTQVTADYVVDNDIYATGDVRDDEDQT